MQKKSKNKINRIICLALAMIMLLVAASCGSGGTGTAGNAGGGGSGGGNAGGAKTDSAQSNKNDAGKTEDADSGAGKAGNADSQDNRAAAKSDSAAINFTEGEISGDLSISAFDSMQFKAMLESAAEMFKEVHPGINMTVETFSTMPEIKRQESADGRSAVMAVRMEDNPQERTDYVKKINTSLMSGEGPDILAMDILPVSKYVESGLLENLALYMDGDPQFDRSEYRANILDAVTWKNGTWFIPMDYNFNYYTYDTTLITDGAADFGLDSSFTTERLIELGKPFYDGETKLLNIQDYNKGMGQSAWARLLREHWSDFVDIAGKRAHFTDGGFVELLNLVKKYGGEGYILPGATGQVGSDEMMRRMGQAPTDRFFFKPKSNMQLLQFFMRGSVARFGVVYGGASAIEDDDEIAGIAANADGSVPFTYTQAFAINANSKNKRAAWEFIKFMLSGEMQESGAIRMFRGLPLHNKTRATQIENMLASMSAGMRGSPGFGQNAGFGRIIEPGRQGGGGSGGQGGGQGGQQRQSNQNASSTASASEAAGTGGSGGQGDKTPIVKGEGSGGASEGSGDADKAGDNSGDADKTSKGSGDAASVEKVVGESINEVKASDGAPGDRSPITEIDPEVLKKYYEATERLSDLINTFEIKDATIDDVIAEEVHYFFEGTKTAEEVAKTLQNKVELYLNE